MIRYFLAAAAALTLIASSANAGDEEIKPPNTTGELVLAYAHNLPSMSSRFVPADPELILDFLDPERHALETSPRPLPRPENLYENHVLAGLPRTLQGADDFMCLAVSIYHEARGETLEGQAAVASVIMQRARVPGRWGDTICEVTVPVQFSYLNADKSFAPINDYASWERAVDVATVAMVDGPDPWLMGADHYHTDDVKPVWRHKLRKIEQIGAHIFYTDPASERRIELMASAS